MIFFQISLFIGNIYRLSVGDLAGERGPHRSRGPEHVPKVPNGKEVPDDKDHSNRFVQGRLWEEISKEMNVDGKFNNYINYNISLIIIIYLLHLLY